MVKDRRPERRDLRRGALALVVLASLFATRPALADARAEARAHFKAGMAAIAAKSYEQGIAELEAAYAILPHPNVLFNIARAHAEASHTQKALDAYKRYLESDPQDREEVAKVVSALELRLAQEKAAALPRLSLGRGGARAWQRPSPPRLDPADRSRGIFCTLQAPFGCAPPRRARARC